MHHVVISPCLLQLGSGGPWCEYAASCRLSYPRTLWLSARRSRMSSSSPGLSRYALLPVSVRQANPNTIKSKTARTKTSCVPRREKPIWVVLSGWSYLYYDFTFIYWRKKSHTNSRSFFSTQADLHGVIQYEVPDMALNRWHHRKHKTTFSGRWVEGCKQRSPRSPRNKRSITCHFRTQQSTKIVLAYGGGA